MKFDVNQTILNLADTAKNVTNLQKNNILLHNYLLNNVTLIFLA